MTASQSSSVSSSAAPMRLTPALFTRIVGVPSREAISAAAASTEAVERTSNVRPRCPSPSDAATAAVATGSREVTATRAPASARARATASPMPFVAPVQPARGLAARRVDEPKFAVADHHPGQHAGLAQQPLEPLLRCRLPALDGAAFVGIGAGRLQPDQKLPRRVAIEALHRPVGRQRRVVLRHGDGEIVRQARPARRTGDEARIPAEHGRGECPGIGKGRPVVLGEPFLDLRGVGLRLPLGDERPFLDHRRRQHEAGGPDVVEPFEVGIADDAFGHAVHDHPVTGQR